jgi:WD40 repeat protein
LEGHTAPVFAVTFSKDGKTLISGSLDRSLKVWDLDQGSCLHTLTGHQNTIASLNFYQETLISSSFDETIRFWDYRVGSCLKTQRAPRPYEALNIINIRGISELQQVTLKALGAVESRENNLLTGSPS